MNSPNKTGVSSSWGKESMKMGLPEIKHLKIKLKNLEGTEEDSYPSNLFLHKMDPNWHKFTHASFSSQVRRIKKQICKFYYSATF